jgi:hypothetical protein
VIARTIVMTWFFSRMFGADAVAMPLGELLVLAEFAASKEFRRLVIEWNYARETTTHANETRDEALGCAAGALSPARPNAEGTP